MTAVRFLKHYQVFNVGEVAGFPQPVVDGLLRSGIAELVTDTPKGTVKDIPKAATGAAGPDQTGSSGAGAGVPDDDQEPDAAKQGRRGSRQRG